MYIEILIGLISPNNKHIEILIRADGIMGSISLWVGYWAVFGGIGLMGVYGGGKDIKKVFDKSGRWCMVRVL